MRWVQIDHFALLTDDNTRFKAQWDWLKAQRDWILSNVCTLTNFMCCIVCATIFYLISSRNGLRRADPGADPEVGSAPVSGSVSVRGSTYQVVEIVSIRPDGRLKKSVFKMTNSRIPKGSYGDVFKVLRLPDGKTLAAKSFFWLVESETLISRKGLWRRLRAL